MTDSRVLIVDWLRREFAAEQSEGFLRLKRVPDTRVIGFLDHFASLSPEKQSELAAVLADWSSYRLLQRPIPPATVEEFSRATAFPGSVEGPGLRYSGMNLLAGFAKEAGQAGLGTWFQTRGITGLALQLPQTLVRDVADLVPVKIPTLRRLVKVALAQLFAPSVRDIGSEMWRYEEMLAGSSLKVLIRYSGRMGRPQLDYSVEVRGEGRVLSGPSLCFESILGAGFGGWNYLTQENAERSVGLFCELIEYVARLPGRLPEG
jgi:hypothetical protein